MKKVLLAFTAIVIFVSHLTAQSDLDYFLPDKIKIDPEIPSPSEVLGYEIGDKHASHDEIVRYLNRLAEKSDRIGIKTYGYTHEGRPLLLLTISDPENLQNIEKIRSRHVALSDPDSEVSSEGEPVVIWMGYSVHGNEASGANAALMVAYYLAAGNSEELNTMLKDVVVLMDPCINPDGYSRFAQWVNQFRSKVTISDPDHLELNEPWPGGRTNHYWVDLNRDWLLLQQPESRARLAEFHNWLPNILTDHHEMGSNSTFFFQPGIPSRNNPETPVSNILLTEKIAAYHAEALDRIGSLYYTMESFDDFYYGKGSTYPDINGSIGILFEQASSRGYSRSTDNGILSFAFTIRNQFTTSLSTFRAGYELRKELLDHQRNFYREAARESEADAVRAYVIDHQGDRIKMYHFLRILEQHQIRLFSFSGNTEAEGHNYEGSQSIVIPTGQRQYKLIRNLFENVLEYQDSLFYDVSAWTLPPAFDLKYGRLNAKQLKDLELTAYSVADNVPAGKLSGESDFGYLVRWNEYHAPMVLYRLLEKGLRVMMAEKSFSTTDGVLFKPGTLFIPAQNQNMEKNTLRYILAEAAKESAMDILPVKTGFTKSGINLGSPNMTVLKKPDILLLVGEGVSSYEAGEVWHLFDVRLGIPVTLAGIDQFNSLNLDKYNRIVMVNGNYREISDRKKKDLTEWLENGGNIVAFKGGARWLSSQKMAFIEFRQSKPDTIDQKNYEDLSRYRGAQEIGGSIFRASIDLSHPLCFGFPDDELFIFKEGKYFFEKPKNPYNMPVMFGDDPLVSGYISRENYKNIKNSPAVIVSAIGRGRTICFSDDPVFRDYWFGSDRLFLNAVFLGSLISVESAR